MLKKLEDRMKKFMMKKDVKEGKTQVNSKYKGLTPVDNLDEDSEYLKALNWAYENEDVKNVALTGSYGSGKSSIIRTFRKNHPKIKSIGISLASFMELKQDENGAYTEKMVEYEEQVIEEGILKQLFYKVDGRKIPESRFKKIHSVDKIRVFVYNVCFFLFVLGFLLCFLPDTSEKILNTFIGTCVEKGMDYLSVLLIDSFIFLCACAILSYLTWKLSGRFQVREIRLHDKITMEEKQGNDSSVLNKYIDEILYFFEQTKYEVVFFEDLDRFDSLQIFIKLREINGILNNYERIHHKIMFVYAMRDDVFSGKDRTKFYDFMIPVVPVINATNSKEILLDFFQADSEERVCYFTKIHNRCCTLY